MRKKTILLLGAAIALGALCHPGAVRQLAVPKVLAVARLVERKGIAHLIDALASLGTDAEYVIAGDGPQRAMLEARARALGLSVAFLGQVDRDRLGSLYASSSIFVLPSARENFPMVLLEAMSAAAESPRDSSLSRGPSAVRSRRRPRI